MSDMNARVSWLKNDVINFSAKSGSGHEVIIDSAQTLGAKPMEFILMGLGGCASYDVVSILQNPVKRSRTSTAKSLPSVPMRFLRCSLTFICTLWCQARMSKNHKLPKRSSCLRPNTARPQKCWLMAV